MSIYEQPEQLGKYQLLKRVAVGGMAEVFLGRAAGPAGFSKLVAIKRIHRHLSEEREFVEMFLDEARLASRLDHPNICQIIDLGRVEDEYFLAMEYIHGKNLRELVSKANEYGKALPLEAIFTISIGVLSALNFAHTRPGPGGSTAPVIHRDISPQNILISYAGNVKLVDFGIAKAQDRVHVTQEGIIKGKAYYMAPEQMYEGKQDARVDLYAFGVVLYEMLTGRKLFGKYTHSQMFNPALRKPVPLPSKVVPTRPPELDPIVMRCLARNPDKRYQSAAELITALEELMLTIRQVASSERLAQSMRRFFAVEIEREDLHLTQAATPPPNQPPPAPQPARTGSTARSGQGGAGPQLMMPPVPLDATDPAAEPTDPTNPMPADGDPTTLAGDERTTLADGTQRPEIIPLAEARTVIKHTGELASAGRRGASAEASRDPLSELAPTDTMAVTNPAIRTSAIIEGDGTRMAPAAGAPPSPDTGSLVRPAVTTVRQPPRRAPWAVIGITAGLALVAASIGLHAVLSSAPPPADPGESKAGTGSQPTTTAIVVAGGPDAGGHVVKVRTADPSVNRVRLRRGTVTPIKKRRTARRARGKAHRTSRRAGGQGSLSLAAVPGGKVYLGRRCLGPTPLSGVRIPAGAHTLHLRNAGLGLDYPFRLRVTPGQRLSHQVQVGRGTLRINAIPWARVFLDGKMLDVTPIKPMQLYAGRHVVELVYPGPGGKQRHRTVVTVRAGGNHKVIHNFLRTP